jgi:trimeric autotransporter adhesin
MINRRSLAGALALAALASIGCSRSDGNFDYLEAGRDFSLAKGRSFDMTGLAVNHDNTGANVTADVVWESSAPDVVEMVLEPRPHVVARQEGVAEIRATYRDSVDVFQITVTPHVFDEMIVLADKEGISQDETLQHRFALVYSDSQRTDLAAGETVEWESSDPTVAYIDAATGLVTALGPGKVTITATLKLNGNFFGDGSRSLSVEGYPVSISLFPNSQEMLKGRAYELVPLALFSDGYRKSLSPYVLEWSSSDKAIAKVSSTGVVTAVAPGTATITVKMMEPVKDAPAVPVLDPLGVAIEATADVTVYTFPAPAAP